MLIVFFIITNSFWYWIHHFISYWIVHYTGYFIHISINKAHTYTMMINNYKTFMASFLLLTMGTDQVSSFTTTTTTTHPPSPSVVTSSSSSSSSTTTHSNSVLRSTTNGGEIEEVLPTPTSDVVQKVAVTGATGKTGKLVVEELLQRNVKVVGMVRNLTKAEEMFGKYYDENDDESQNLLEITKVDLTNEEEIQTTLEGCDAVIWCATGFADEESPATTTTSKKDATEEPSTGIIQTVKNFFFPVPVVKEEEPEPTPKQQPNLQKSIDKIGLPIIAKAMMMMSDGPTTNDGDSSSEDQDANTTTNSNSYPKVVMMSSAGVTRPSWSESKKQLLKGCADIPIVRLNPFGILDIKADSEEQLRQSGTYV